VVQLHPPLSSWKKGELERMNAKEYLQQAFKIDRLVKSKIEQVAKLESLATTATQNNFSLAGVPTSHDDSHGSKIENLVVDIVILKEQVNAQTAELLKLRGEIQQTLGRIDNLTVRFLLEERYLLYKSWDEICYETGFSRDYVYRLHRQGLSSVEQIRGEKR